MMIGRASMSLAAFTLGAMFVLASAAMPQQADNDHVSPPVNTSIQFRAVEIFVDVKDQPLAAYQLEFKPVRGEVKIVGIEGGEHPAFNNPPYYDAAAMMNERVIIADFSTAGAHALPSGRTRIATIHVQVSGDVEPEFTANPTVLATVDGKAIPATIHLN